MTVIGKDVANSLDRARSSSIAYDEANKTPCALFTCNRMLLMNRFADLFLTAFFL